MSGRATTERLVERGWEVLIIDLAEEADISRAEYVQRNILDFDDLR